VVGAWEQDEGEATVYVATPGCIGGWTVPTFRRAASGRPRVSVAGALGGRCAGWPVRWARVPRQDRGTPSKAVGGGRARMRVWIPCGPAPNRLGARGDAPLRVDFPRRLPASTSRVDFPRRLPASTSRAGLLRRLPASTRTKDARRAARFQVVADSSGFGSCRRAADPASTMGARPRRSRSAFTRTRGTASTSPRTCSTSRA